ncbi:MAG: Uma2 family endonuclease [Armatimonadetes bacterium]|nr:Uma2 family endonuclease [Armatimonadota bacterium]
MDSPQPRFTYADVEKWDPDTRWELIDGIPYAMAGCSLLHQSLLGELHVALKLHFKGSPCRVVLAPFDVKFSERDVVQPDLLVSCSDRLGYQFHTGAPDLVIEILSPSTLRHDRIRKLGLYSRQGVREYWLVTPHPLVVEVLENIGEAFVTRGAYSEEHHLRSPRFPDLDIDLAEIFAGLPPQPPIADEVRETVPPTYAPAEQS